MCRHVALGATFVQRRDHTLDTRVHTFRCATNQLHQRDGRSGYVSWFVSSTTISRSPVRAEHKTQLRRFKPAYRLIRSAKLARRTKYLTVTVVDASGELYEPKGGPASDVYVHRKSRSLDASTVSNYVSVYGVASSIPRTRGPGSQSRTYCSAANGISQSPRPLPRGGRFFAKAAIAQACVRTCVRLHVFVYMTVNTRLIFHWPFFLFSSRPCDGPSYFCTREVRHRLNGCWTLLSHVFSADANF